MRHLVCEIAGFGGIRDLQSPDAPNVRMALWLLEGCASFLISHHSRLLLAAGIFLLRQFRDVAYIQEQFCGFRKERKKHLLHTKVPQRNIVSVRSCIDIPLSPDLNYYLVSGIIAGAKPINLPDRGLPFDYYLDIRRCKQSENEVTIKINAVEYIGRCC